MLTLMLARDLQQTTRTHGRLYVEGRFECYTLEDQLRPDPDPATPANEAKVDGATAIPAGRYRIVLENSPKLGKDCLTIKDVPGFTHIRIHAGNDERHTEGCVLVGLTREAGRIGGSRAALGELRRKLVPVLEAGAEAWIRVVDVPETT